VSENSNGRGSITAALIVSAAVIAGSLVIANSLEHTAKQVEIAGEFLSDLPIAAAPAEPDRPRRPRRPDPAQEYKVAVGEAPVRGDAEAPITIVEWSDFQCPFCVRAAPTLAQIQKEYGSKVRIVFKHLPLSIHAKAPAAHAAAEAAHRQGKFWEMHDKIFENQRDLAATTLERYARELGLDVERYQRDIESVAVKKRIDDDMQQARDLSVTGTPAFFINGRFLSGAQPFANFKRVIDSALEETS
jgi:protein-disulfide isomerase